MKQKQGYTLIELLVVLVILGVIVLFASVAYAEYVEDAKEVRYKTEFDKKEKELVDNLVRGRLPRVYPVNFITLREYRDKEGKLIAEQKIQTSPELWGFFPTGAEGYTFYIGQQKNQVGDLEYFVFSAKSIQEYQPWAMMKTIDGRSDARHLPAQDGYAGVYTIDGESSSAYTVQVDILGVREASIRPVGENPSFTTSEYMPEIRPDGRPDGLRGKIIFSTKFSKTPAYFVLTLKGDTTEEHLVICKNMYDSEPLPPPNPGDGW